MEKKKQVFEFVRFHFESTSDADKIWQFVIDQFPDAIKDGGDYIVPRCYVLPFTIYLLNMGIKYDIGASETVTVYNY